MAPSSVDHNPAGWATSAPFTGESATDDRHYLVPSYRAAAVSRRARHCRTRTTSTTDDASTTSVDPYPVTRIDELPDAVDEATTATALTGDRSPRTQ